MDSLLIDLLALGASKHSIAKHCKVSWNTVQNWIKGFYQPSEKYRWAMTTLLLELEAKKKGWFYSVFVFFLLLKIYFYLFSRRRNKIDENKAWQIIILCYTYIMDKRLTVTIDAELHAQAKARAYGEGKTLREKMIELLREWLCQEVKK